jgi:hypothetical protein
VSSNQYRLIIEINHEILSILFQVRVTVVSYDANNYLHCTVVNHRFEPNITLFQQQEHTDLIVTDSCLKKLALCQEMVYDVRIISQIIEENFHIDNLYEQYQNIDYQVKQ